MNISSHLCLVINIIMLACIQGSVLLPHSDAITFVFFLILVFVFTLSPIRLFFEWAWPASPVISLNGVNESHVAKVAFSVFVP